MKKVTSKNKFSFRIDSKTLLDISPDGVLCSDEQAKFLQNRLGGTIMVQEVNVKEEIEKIISNNL